MVVNDHILRFTQEAYDRLRLLTTQNPEIYLDPDTDFAAVLANDGINHYAEPTGITANGPISLQPVKSGDRYINSNVGSQSLGAVLMPDATSRSTMVR